MEPSINFGIINIPFEIPLSQWKNVEEALYGDASDCSYTMTIAEGETVISVSSDKREEVIERLMFRKIWVSNQ